MKLPITVLILTKDEEVNLRYCLESVKGHVEDIIIVDSPSSDNTENIAREYTDKVFIHPFKNHADQYNWALDNLDIKTEWILKLDADERMTTALWSELESVLPGTPSSVSGFFMKRRFYFLGKWIRFGGYYPVWLLRLWRTGKGRSEDREMDENIITLEGETIRLKHDFIHDDHKTIHEWIAKHNIYSSREAALNGQIKNRLLVAEDILGNPAEKKRWLRNKFYFQLPLFLRVFLYFFYRYILRLGFLDGSAGLVFHSLQGFWHMFLIDAKFYEQKIRNKQ